MMVEKKFKYEWVATKVEERIINLGLKPGDRITSVRQLSKELGVSLSTVFHAYELLINKGVIVSRERSGYIINIHVINNEVCEQKNIDFIPVDVKTTSMAIAIMNSISQNNLINFSILSPSNELLPLSKLNKCVTFAMNASNNENYQYSIIGGKPELIKHICTRAVSWNNPLKFDEILVTNGCMEAINLCLDVVAKKGDIIAVESPCFNGILQSLEQRGLQALQISTSTKQGVNLQELEKALDNHFISACIFMPSCHNPTGATMSEVNKIKLVEMLGKRQIPLIEDDSLRELYFKGNIFPAKSYDNYDNVLYCSSFSKTLAPGFRIGFVSGGRFHQRIQTLKYVSNISTNGVFQDAIGKYLSSGHFDRHLNRMRTELQKQSLKYIHAISSYFPKNTKVSIPSGGLSLWIELPSEINGYQLQRNVLKHKIAICSGIVFSPNTEMFNYIRINFGTLFSTKIEKAIKTIGVVAQNMVGDSIKLSK